MLRVRLVMGMEEMLGLVMVGWGDIDMVSELGYCGPAPMPLRVITILTMLQSHKPTNESQLLLSAPISLVREVSSIITLLACNG